MIIISLDFPLIILQDVIHWSNIISLPHFFLVFFFFQTECIYSHFSIMKTVSNIPECHLSTIKAVPFARMIHFHAKCKYAWMCLSFIGDNCSYMAGFNGSSVITGGCWSSAGARSPTSPPHFIFAGPRVNLQNWPFIISAWLAQSDGCRTHANTSFHSRLGDSPQSALMLAEMMLLSQHEYQQADSPGIVFSDGLNEISFRPHIITGADCRKLLFQFGQLRLDSY